MCLHACYVYVPPKSLCSSFLLSFVITYLFHVLCESCVFVCSFSYLSHVWLCLVFLHVCMNLVCLCESCMTICVFGVNAHF